MIKGARVYIGFLSYGRSTAKYLPDFLASLTKQIDQSMVIVNYDNTPADQDQVNQLALQSFPQVQCLSSGKNLGFAKAYNQLIELAWQAGAEYFLVINPDTILQPEAIAELVNHLDRHPQAAAAMPKILRWDFAHQTVTDYVDSLGVALAKNGAFFDDQQGCLDSQIKEIQPIFGFSGAAVLLRLSALKEVAFDNGHNQEYFDELMFMYKEDCDLSYRLQLAGWLIDLVPTAIVYHDRTAIRLGRTIFSQLWQRRQVSRLVRGWSIAHQLIIFFKYHRLAKRPLTRIREIVYIFQRLITVIVLEPFAWPYLWRVWLQRRAIEERQQALVIKINPLALEGWRR
ncbi:MAG TPA: glycosyltransferase family 2 protein [bacterium]|nr:glycosyltransferase family 2 protein [bacterium]